MVNQQFFKRLALQQRKQGQCAISVRCGNDYQMGERVCTRKQKRSQPIVWGDVGEGTGLQGSLPRGNYAFRAEEPIGGMGGARRGGCREVGKEVHMEKVEKMKRGASTVDRRSQSSSGWLKCSF